MVNRQPHKVDRLQPPHGLVCPHEKAGRRQCALERLLVRSGITGVRPEEEEAREVEVQIEPTGREEFIGLANVSETPLI